MTTNTRLVTMLEISMMSALAIVFSFITPFQFWPNGGSVSFVMIPIAILAFRRGILPGLVCGFLTGSLLLILPGAVRMHPLQMILDYPVAYFLLGTAGVAYLKKSMKPSLVVFVSCMSLLLAASLRLFAHFWSGVVFFQHYAPPGKSVYLFSLFYNMSYIIPEIVLAIIITSFIILSSPHLVYRAR